MSAERPTPRRLKSFSPLRYPGGKAKLAPFVKALIDANKLSDGIYVEPYAGGAGIGVELLLQEYASKIYINDISRPIWAFWNSVLFDTASLIRLIRKASISVPMWDKQKRILQNSKNVGSLELGFAAFFLNRTNRSGILNGGIIGGRDQTGPWKIDARFNKEELVYRINAIARMKSRVVLSNEDAETFLRKGFKVWPAKTLVYLDPPYYIKGGALYYDSYSHANHETIAKLLTSVVRRQKWIVSYDNVRPVRSIYEGCRRIEYSLGYSAREVRMGREVMFLGDSVELPELTAKTNGKKLIHVTKIVGA